MFIKSNRFKHWVFLLFTILIVFGCIGLVTHWLWFQFYVHLVACDGVWSCVICTNTLFHVRADYIAMKIFGAIDTILLVQNLFLCYLFGIIIHILAPQVLMGVLVSLLTIYKY